MTVADHDLSPAAPRAARPRIIVLRPDHLGDLLLTLPALRLLRRSLAQVHITCMVAADLVPLAGRAVDVDEVLPLPFTMHDPPPDPRSPELGAAARSLRRRFDLAILPRPDDPWSGALAAAAKIPVRMGHPQPRTLPFLTHAVPEDPRRHVAAEARELALRAAVMLGGAPPVLPARPDALLRLLHEDHAGASSLLSRLGLGLGQHRPILVHPTAGWMLKTWPADRWTTVVSELGARLRSPILVAGRPSERGALEKIGRGRRGIYVVDDASIGVLAALHARARLVVGIDSGALHLAALLGTPVVGLFGPFAPQRMGPIGANGVTPLWSGVPCSPCGMLEAPPCGASAEPACLRAITPQEVVAAAVKLNAGNERPARFSVPP